MSLRTQIKNHTASVGIIGLGYVGLPIARAFSRRGFPVLGFDIDPEKVRLLEAGQSYIQHIPPEEVEEMLEAGFEPTVNFDRLSEPDAILICVPTPLGEHQDPDTSYI